MRALAWLLAWTGALLLIGAKLGPIRVTFCVSSAEDEDAEADDLDAFRRGMDGAA